MAEYGPENATCVLYVDGLLASNSLAYSSGTGADSGITSAWARMPPAHLSAPSPGLRLKTIVVSSGVSMPGIFVPGLAPTFAPSRPPKYGPA